MLAPGGINRFDCRFSQRNFFMPFNFLGKALFPRQQPWLQRRRVNTILVTLLVAVVAAGIAVVIMFFSNSRR